MTVGEAPPPQRRPFLRAYGQSLPHVKLRNYAYLLISIVLCGVLLGPIYRPAGHGLDVFGYQIGRDFINVWAAPRLAFSGQIARLFNLGQYAAAISQQFGQPIPFHNWSYPPFALIAFWPISQLPYFWALAVWSIGLFGLYAVAARALVPVDARLYLTLALACSPASIINLLGGQNGFLSAALFLGGVLLCDRRPLIAGVLFGLLTFKPQLGLVLPLALLALGAWRTIFAAVLTAALLVGASIVIFGLEPWTHYLGDTSAYQLGLLKVFRGFYPCMMTSVLAGARIFGAPFSVAAVIQAAVSVPVGLLAAWTMRWTDVPARRAFILASAAALMTPYAFNYDLTALSATILWRLTVDPPPAGSLRETCLRLAWLAPILMMWLNAHAIGVAPFFILAVFIMAVWEVRPNQPKMASAGPGPIAPELDQQGAMLRT